MKLITNPYSFDAVTVTRDKHDRAIVKAKIMKVGQLKYYDPTTGEEFVGEISLDALEKAKQSCSMKSVTIKHPSKMLDGGDVKMYEHGMSASNPKIEKIDGETWLTNDLVLQTDKAIETVEKGKLGISAGYFRFPKKTNEKGVFKFEDIDINHIAIGCDNPRAEGAGISLDEQSSELATLITLNPTAKPKNEVKMKRTLNAVKIGADFSLDEVQIEYVDDADQVVEKMVGREKMLLKHIQGQQTSMDEARETSATKLGELSGEIKGLKAQVEKLEKEKANMMSMDEIDDHIAKTAEVKALAKTFGVTENFKTVEEGHKLIVAKAYPDVSFDESEIAGAIKTIKANSKDIKDQKDSKDALAKVETSMDDAGSSVTGILNIPISELKKKIGSK